MSDVKMTLSNTGERLIPDAEHEQWNLRVHLDRYLFAKHYLHRTARVLDYGCGVGYGIHSLADLTDGECVGVDKEEAITFARARYQHTNLSFYVADLTEVTARFGLFDVIVSFDVIEHVDHVDAYLDNIARQLRDNDSVAMISTPWSSRRRNIKPLHNPFHEVEFTFTEFNELLKAHFCIDRMDLTIGMMAVVKRRQGNHTAPTTVTLTTEHLCAIEEMLEDEATAHELLLPLADSLTDYVSATMERLHNNTAHRLMNRVPWQSANVSYVERCTVSGGALSGVFLALACKTNRGLLEVAVRHEGDLIATQPLPGWLLKGRAGYLISFPSRTCAPGDRVEVEVTAHGSDLQSLGLVKRSPSGSQCLLTYRRYRWRGAPLFSQDPVWMYASGSQLVEFDRKPLGNLTTGTTLPTIDKRPWVSDTTILLKTWRSFRTYGIHATVHEIMVYLKRR